MVTFIVWCAKKTLLYGRLSQTMRSKEYHTSEEYHGLQHGRGMFPGAFDPDDWADMTSMIGVPVYVAKGRGKYAETKP